MVLKLARLLTTFCWLVAFSTVVRCAEPARTDRLPPALRATGARASAIVSQSEANAIRARFFGAGPIAAQTTMVPGGDAAAVFGRYHDVLQRAGVAELPGGISYFHGVFFGDGVLVNQNTGRGAIFVADNPAAGTLFFSNLMGDYSVQRLSDGTTAIVTPGLW